MIDYKLPGGGQRPDLFKGFREELGVIKQNRQDKEERGIKMASMIEMSDQSTMFGGDYSEAQQMAEWMTDHLDDFSSSADGMIEFQQMATQLNNFIDASETYKKENFGTADAGPKAGTFMGGSQRALTDVNAYEADGFMDTRTKQDYEMTYMGLNQERRLEFDEQGKPVLSQRGRSQNPFMPQLEELPFEGGFEWFEGNAKGHKFPDGWNDAKTWLEQKMQDEKLKRRIARDHAKQTGNTGEIDELMQQETFMEGARQRFLAGAKDSFDAHSGTPKPETPKTFIEMEQEFVSGYYEDFDVPEGDSVVIDRIIPGRGKDTTTKRQEINQESLGFNSMSILKKPLTSAQYPSLGDDTRVIGFNIDRNGQIWVLKDELYEEEMINPDTQAVEVIERKRRVGPVKADNDLQRTLELNLPPALLREYRQRSFDNSVAARNRRQDERFDNADRIQAGGDAIDGAMGPMMPEAQADPVSAPNYVGSQEFFGPTMERGGILSRFRNIFRT